MAQEIERRFLLKHLPDLTWHATIRIRQGYIGDNAYEVRLRERAVSCGPVTCQLCRKEGTGLVREEHELDITPAHFAMLWPLAAARSLKKVRQIHSTGDLLAWEFDLFESLTRDDGSPLALLEVELPHPRYELTLLPEVLPLIEAEITGLPEWLNSSLAKNGLPTAVPPPFTP